MTIVIPLRQIVRHGRYKKQLTRGPYINIRARSKHLLTMVLHSLSSLRVILSLNIIRPLNSASNMSNTRILSKLYSITVISVSKSSEPVHETFDLPAFYVHGCLREQTFGNRLYQSACTQVW